MGGLICVLEPDALTLRLLSQVLEAEGFRTLLLSESAGALAIIKERRPDLLVLDTALETPNAGWTLLETIRSDVDTGELPVIVCTADVAGVEKRAALLAGPPETGVLIKPFEPQELISRIRAVLPTQPSV